MHNTAPPPMKSYLAQMSMVLGSRNPALQLSAIEKSLDMAFKATGARTHGRCGGAGTRWVKTVKGFGSSAALPPSQSIKGQTRRGLGGQAQLGNLSLEKCYDLSRLSDPINRCNPVFLNPKKMTSNL